MDEVNYTYYGKFEGDILAVGRTEYGKTTSVQNLGNLGTVYLEILGRSIGYRKLNFFLIERTI